ncbi:amidohydrolase [Chloroflexota bacterium]
MNRITDKAQIASLVLRKGRILTLDETYPEVEALAVSGDHIIAVGSDADITLYIGPETRVIDLAGRLTVPGFIEGHGHFIELGKSLMALDLTKTDNWETIVAMVADAARHAQPGTWVMGHGWHQDKWHNPAVPGGDRFLLDGKLNAAAPDNPVLLSHASYHAMIVNAQALAVAGIHPDAPAPPPGGIMCDASGRLVGLLRDSVQDVVYEALRYDEQRQSPERTHARLREQARLAARDVLSKGITAFVDQGVSFETLDFYKKLAGEGELPLRLYTMVGGEPVNRLEAKLPDYRLLHYGIDGYLTIRTIGEVLVDGAVGTHTAWFLKPYADLPDSTGLNVVPLTDVRQIAELALRYDYQLAVHAIGDRANHEVLDTFAAVFKAHNVSGLRWRIEHAQHLDPADIPRFAELGVIASMQAVHATSDGAYIVKRFGEKRAREGAYVWRSLLQSGAVIASGTDTPVEDENPMANFHSAVTRRLNDGSRFYPEQRMSRPEALRSYTLANAYAIFEEDRLGTLGPGKLADITVLSRDIMEVPEDEIPGTQVDYTIVGGRVAWEQRR